MTDLALNIAIRAADSASPIFGNLVRSIGQSNSVLGVATGLAIGAGAAVVGFGVKSVQMAAQYQSGMNMVQALTGSSTQQMQQYDASLKALAVDAGVAPDALSKGLYNVLSAGFQGAQAMNVLTLATQDSKIGMTDAATTTNALTNILNSFSVKAGDVTRVNGEMLQTVTMGKATFQQYATTITNAASSSVQFGVSMETMNAAWATLTSSGISAAHATTDYSQSLKVMYGNIGTVSKSLEKNGIAFDEAKFNAMSYGDKVVYLNSALDQARAKHVTITGATLQAAQAIQTISQHIGTYNTDLASLSDKQAMAQKTAQAWAITQGGFSQQMSRMSAAVQVLMINIGTALLPVLTQVAGAVTNVVSALAEAGSATSPLAPIFANVSGMMKVMASVWSDFSTSSMPTMNAFKQFGALLGQLLPGSVSQFLRIAAQINLVFVDIASAVSQWAVPGLKLFGQIFQGVQQAAEPVINVVTGQLIPAIHNLITSIAPIVTAILQWVASSNIIPIAFTVISVAIQIVVVALSVLINVISAVITWFSTTAVGIAAFRAVLVILGIAITLIGTIILAVVIPAFIAWVAGAIAVGIANVIAFAPIILIVLAIVAVVTLVVLVITHWGEIAHWLQGVWSATVSWFQGALSAVGGWFTNLWHGIQTTFGNIGGWFQDRFKQASDGAKTAFGNIGGWFQDRGKDISSNWNKAMTSIGDSEIWLYNHNYYVKAAVDAIVQQTAAAKAWLSQAWTATVTFISTQWARLVGFASSTWGTVSSFVMGIVTAVVTFVSTQWQRLVGFVTVIWNQITVAIQSAIQAAWNWIVSIWTTIATWLQTQWNRFAGFAQTAWQAVSTVFASIWNTYVAAPLNNLWNQFVTWFNSLGTQAQKSGQNFIQMLVNGITSGAGAIWNAVTSIANTIWTALGFHSPAKAGPGKDADTWMPNLVNMLSTGLIAGVPQMQTAANNLATPLTTLASGGATGTAPQPRASGGHVFNVTIQIDGRTQRTDQDLTDMMINKLSQQFLRSGLTITPTKGM